MNRDLCDTPLNNHHRTMKTYNYLLTYSLVSIKSAKSLKQYLGMCIQFDSIVITVVYIYISMRVKAQKIVIVAFR